jgi:YbbR domain-containing protein
MPAQDRSPTNIRVYILWLTLGLVTAGVIAGILNILPDKQTETKEIFAELVLTGLPEELITTHPPVKFVGARVTGPAALVDNLTVEQLTCTLDLGGLAPGPVSLPLTAENFALPTPLEITAIKPGVITLRIKAADRKTVPVYITIAGKPAAGYAVRDTFAVPAKVTVTGPENRLSGMARVMTKPIFIEGITDSIKKETALDLPPGVRVSGLDNALVADIRVGAKTTRRTFSKIRVTARRTGHTAVFSPPVIVLDVEGPSHALAQLDQAADIAAYVDLAGIKPGVYVKRASISLPLNLTLVKAEPELFTVSVVKKDQHK